MALLQSYGLAFKERTANPARADWSSKHATKVKSDRDNMRPKKYEVPAEVVSTAKALGVHPMYLDKILSGKVQPSEAFLRHIGSKRDLSDMVAKLRAKFCS